MGEMRNTNSILFEKMKGMHHLEYLGRNGRK
jgi:hypothetical protein